MTAEEYGQTIANFLMRPADRIRFGAFYQVCWIHTCGVLRHLQRVGWSLPLDQFASDHPINDLAIDILGSFLRTAKGRKYGVVLDFFDTRPCETDTEPDTRTRYDQFCSLIVGFVKQEVRRLRPQVDPQRENLKRRFKDILTGPDYAVPPIDGSACDLVCSVAALSCPRSDRPLISYENLREMALTTYQVNLSRSQWCRAIFTALQESIGVANHVRRSDLLRAVVAANMAQVDTFCAVTEPASRVDPTLFEGDIHSAREQALQSLRTDLLPRFVRQGRLSSEESTLLARGAELYLIDLAYSPGVDKLPDYFREVMPADTHDRYLKDYKYVFETTVQHAERKFKEILREIL